MKLKTLSKLIMMILAISLITGVAIAGKDMTTITGTVEKTDAGFVITTAEGEYAAEGADLAPMVGKKIEATGKVAESDQGMVINVLAVKEVKE